MILDQIVEKRKQQLLKEQSAIGLEEMKALAMQDSRTCISLYDALETGYAFCYFRSKSISVEGTHLSRF